MSPEEKEHIESARQGDKDAYRFLVEAYQDRVYRLVKSMVGRQELAEDLTQEVFVKAYFALNKFEGQSAFYTWLFRIASNHCLDHLRKRQPKEFSLDQPLGEDEERSLLDGLEAPKSERPERDLSENQEAGALLGELTDDQRTILTLRELEGYSYEQLADVLKCGVNTIKSRLNRAREALKSAYAERYGNIGTAATVKINREVRP